MCFPKSTVGERIYSNAPDDTSFDRFGKRCLEHLRTKTLLDSTPILYLSKEAKKIWEDYFNDIERAQAKGGDLEDHFRCFKKCRASCDNCGCIQLF